VLRSKEWVLRFQIAGQDQDVQVAELEQAHATLDSLKKETVSGASFGTLLPTDRGRAVLFSSFLNNPTGTRKGVKDAVPEFKVAKVAEFDKAAKEAAKKLTEATRKKRPPKKPR
jgi:hypothetical protein